MILEALFGVPQRKQEQLSADATSDFWYEAVGMRTVAGVRVDQAVARTYSACWAATRLLSGTGGMLPFNLYRRSSGGGSDIAVKHPVYRILHDTPNPEMGSMSFRTSRINHQVNWGNCFAEIERTIGGIPLYLWPIHPSRIPVTTNIIRRNGRLVYLVNNDDGTKTMINQSDMFHVPSMISDDGVIGMGVVENARLSIGYGLATEMQGASAVSGGNQPGLAIKNAEFKTKEDRAEYRRQWDEVHSGPGKAGRPYILPKGADVQPLSFSQRDSQFLESRQHNIEEIARWYGVPPHMIGHLLRSTYANIEHQGIEFVKYSLLPWLKLWEQEVWRKLLTEAEQSVYYAKFVVDALERGDKQSRTTASVQEIFNGLLTINKWAEREDMNPIGPLGDLHWIQQAMVPLEIAAKGPQPKQEIPKLESNVQDVLTGLTTAITDMRQELNTRLESVSTTEIALQARAKAHHQLATAMLNDVFARLLSVEVNNVKRVAEKPSRFDQRLREFYDKHTAALERNLLEPVSVVLVASGDGRDASVVVHKIATEHVTESLRQLDALLDCKTDELAGKVEECVAKWHEERGVSL